MDKQRGKETAKQNTIKKKKTEKNWEAKKQGKSEKQKKTRRSWEAKKQGKTEQQRNWEPEINKTNTQNGRKKTHPPLVSGI